MQFHIIASWAFSWSLPVHSGQEVLAISLRWTHFVAGIAWVGLLYFFTGGFCVIGTIIDLVNCRKLTFEENSKIAQQTSVMVKASV